MSMSSPAVPTPQTPLNQPGVFDPNVVAGAQQTYNTGAGEASQAGSNYNQNNYLGGTNYTQTGTGPGGVPIYSANVSLSPAQQQLLTTLQGTQQKAGGQASDLLTGAAYGSQTPQQAIGNQTQGIEGQITAQEKSYLQPTFDTQTSQLDNQLRNQGLQPGQPGYDNAMRSLTNNQTNQMGNFIAQTQPQVAAQATTQYGLPMSMAESLGGFGAPTNPNTANVAGAALNVQPTNLIGAQTAAQQATDTNYSTEQQAYNAYNQAQMDAYKAQLAQQNAMMSGMFGIGSTLLGQVPGGGLASIFSGAGGGVAPGASGIAGQVVA
jgi:hypothetical protein